MPTRRLGDRTVLAGAALAVMTFAVGVLVERTGLQLGTPYPPFNEFWAPRIELGWSLAAGLVLAATVAALPALLRRPRAPLGFALAVAGLALAVRLLVAAARHGPEGWYRVLDADLSFEGANEYLPALGATEQGPGFLLDRFAELVPSLPVHAAGHPPGMLLVLDALGITTPEGMAALCIGVGALGASATYALGRATLGDESRARTAALLFVLAPSAVLMGAVTADALFATLGTGAAALLVARGTRERAVGALALALSSLFTWALLALGAIAVLVVLARDGLRRAVALAAACGVALVALHAALAAVTGWDPIGAVIATERVYREGIATIRPYWFWLFGSPVAFAVAAGLPVIAWALRALAAGHAVAVALLAVVLVAAVAGFTKGEVERIWVIFVPALCVAAASALPERRLVLAGALLAVQALGAELLLESLW
jgi:hypothetical protein